MICSHTLHSNTSVLNKHLKISQLNERIQITFTFTWSSIITFILVALLSYNVLYYAAQYLIRVPDEVNAFSPCTKPAQYDELWRHTHATWWTSSVVVWAYHQPPTIRLRFRHRIYSWQIPKCGNVIYMKMCVCVSVYIRRSMYL